MRPTVGLALGGGGARGWAHIGVIRALSEAGLEPEVITGTSMGAAVAAAFAAGKLDELEAWALGLDRTKVLGLFDFSFRGGLIQASRVFEHLESILPDVDIESLDIPFAAVATDFERGSAVRLTRGRLRQALRASIAIPGLISPCSLDGRWMVDGGLVDPVPVGPCRALGAEFVIAVELSAARTQPLAVREAPTDTSEPTPPRDPVAVEVEQVGPRPGQSLFQSLSELSDRLLSQVRFPESPAPQPEDTRPSVYQVIGQSLEIMQVRIARSNLAGDPPDLHVVPRLQNVGLLDFDRARDAIPEGKRAAELAISAYADYRRPEAE